MDAARQPELLSVGEIGHPYIAMDFSNPAAREWWINVPLNLTNASRLIDGGWPASPRDLWPFAKVAFP